MSCSYSIIPSVPTQQITIGVIPSSAITPSFSNNVSLTPSPTATQDIDITNATFPIIDIENVPIVGINIPEIGMAAIDSFIGDGTSSGTDSGNITTINNNYTNVVISVGIATNVLSPFALNAFIYTYPNFVLSSPGDFSPGDIVFFKAGSNEYNSDLQLASTATLTAGGIQGCYIFMSYNGTDLTLMQKGYFDFTSESTNFGSWQTGYTIYLNAQGQLDINPSTASGHWVKSFGYCVPNTEGKYRIWFDPDSTYLKIA